MIDRPATEMTRYDTRKQTLDRLYCENNRPGCISPDPLQFVYRCEREQDREITAFLAALFAYGRVAQINKTVSALLAVMDRQPHAYIAHTPDHRIAADFSQMQYRFTRPGHVIALIRGIRRVILDYSSLENCFLTGYADHHETVIPALTRFMEKITCFGPITHLCADPTKKSACKRNHLFLRWMVRKDAVDPGLWKGVCPSKLIVPVDTHMFRIGTLLGFTRRKSADLVTALDITRGFKAFCPEDPVRYDFALTRFGIRDRMALSRIEKMLNEQH